MTVIRLMEPVSVCRACGTAHHEACWSIGPGCGSYACAPARRTSANGAARLRITADDIDRAVPLPAARPAYSAAQAVPARPRTSRMAIASFVFAVLGIPLFGLLTGLVAIILGSLALGGLRQRGQKGTAWAAAGVLLGLADMVGWLILISWTFSGGPHSQILDFQPDPDALDDLPPPIRRGMQANVVIEGQQGLGRLGSTTIGSGVILKVERGDALILTNRHVVDPRFDGKAGKEGKLGVQVNVMVLGGVPQTGRVVWIAPDDIDAALVQAPFASATASAARWDPATRPRVGDAAFAIGNPHGLNWTHTQGTISQFRLQHAAGRRVRLIQTNTAINPGSSGGGLYDHKGSLIGINTWTQDRRVSEGINFAISLESLAELFPASLKLRPNPGNEE